MTNKLLDATKREIQIGQWVVQPYVLGSSLYTRLAYIQDVMLDKGKVRLLKFGFVTPGDWENVPGQTRQEYVLRHHEAAWERSTSLVSNTTSLVIIDAAVALATYDGLAEWIEDQWGGDIVGSPKNTKVKSI